MNSLESPEWTEMLIRTVSCVLFKDQRLKSLIFYFLILIYEGGNGKSPPTDLFSIFSLHADQLGRMRDKPRHFGSDRANGPSSLTLVLSFLLYTVHLCYTFSSPPY